MTSDVDIAQCEHEPIHIPGTIQPHGALLGIREPDMEVVLSSANAGEIFGSGSQAADGHLSKLIDRESLSNLSRVLDKDPRDVNPLDIGLADGRAAHGVVHRSDGLLILEVEPAGDDRLKFQTAYRRLVRRFDRLRRASTVEAVSQIAAREIRKLTGFDRVMVYQFDQLANGAVIAEDRADDTVESFLGLHYPASDIPPQARRLYVENLLRIIVDSNYVPVPLQPEFNPLTGKPLDLSGAALRSVSPVHCQYLRNMGVSASMSISLLDGDRLWGLIACHHREPLHVPYATRLVAEFLSHVLSARIVELERLNALTRKTNAYGVQHKLIDDMVAAPRFQDGLSGDGLTLVDLVDCDGAAVVFRGEITTIGDTPPQSMILELANALAADRPGEVVATDCLGDVHPPAARHADKAAGAITVPLSHSGSDLLFWFRHEQIRSVTWAGDPSKPAVAEPGQQRLMPRASFAAWVEQVRGRSVPWAQWEIEVASDFRTALVASIIHQAAELERLNARLMRANRTKDEFMTMVSHELRNPLNAIMGWVRIARMGLPPDELQEALATIERNADAQTALIDDLLDIRRIESGRLRLDRKPLNMAQLVRRALDTVEPSARSKSISINTSLDENESNVVGDPQRLQQVIWNLLTNAIKYSDADSCIDVRLGRQQSNVALVVTDNGHGIAPELLGSVFEPFRQGKGPGHRTGLGLGLSIDKSIVELHGGTIAAASEGPGRGSTFTVELPVAALRLTDDGGSVALGGVSVNLDNAHVLVVDDNPDAVKMVAALLEHHGATTVCAENGEDALRHLQESDDFTLLISDLDMPRMDGFELAAAVRGDPRWSDLPAVAMTAYTRGGDRARALASGYRHHVSKPVDPEELIVVVGSVLGRLD